MAARKLKKNEMSPITQSYLVSIKQSMKRLDWSNFKHYSLNISDKKLMRYILAKAYTERKFVPDLATEIILKGLAYDKSFQAYVKNDLEISIETSTSMTLTAKNYVNDQQTRLRGRQNGDRSK